MEDPRLFELPVEALALSARFSPQTGWSVMIAWRYPGAQWDDHRVERYSGLTVTELIDVICSDALKRFTV